MILDALDLADGHALDADICIVGGGAVGITLALELRASGLDVLLLESGGEGEEEDTQALYAGHVADETMHSPPDRYRQRRFGGSTTIWGGRCMPYDPVDFETRDYMPHSGWPIGLDAIEPYYPQANQLCEAGPFAYTIGEAFDRPMRSMIKGFESRHFTSDTLERFSCPTDFHARYHDRLARAGVRVLLHANVTGLHLHGDGKAVERLTVKTLAREGKPSKTFSVAAKHVVLAMGGLEIPRLLLANRDVHANGIGNAHDVVGRYYMCHVAGTIGTLTFTGGKDAIWNGYDVSDEGVYCRRRLALTAETQHEERIGNFVARLHFPRIPDPRHNHAVLSALYLAKPIISYEYRKRLTEDEPATWSLWLRHLRNVMLGLPDAFGFAWHMLRDRKLAARKFPSIIIQSRANLYSLDFHAEQAPNPESRITLGPDLDPLGLPRLNVDWRYSRIDVETAERALEILAADIQASGVGRFEYDPASVEHEMTRYGAYGGHHIGTARMGSDPKTSVVDADCRVHGMGNLYVAGSAVFPTSSQANPTLTAVALALRLARHLKENIA